MALPGRPVRDVLLAVIQVLSELRRFLELGFPSIAAQAERTFGYRKTTTYEALRVAEAFGYLPRSRHVFLEGSLSWTALRQIARVAATDTDEAWLEFAEKSGPDRVRPRMKCRSRLLPRKSDR